MTLGEKIFIDLKNIFAFIRGNNLTDGEENAPYQLIMAWALVGDTSQPPRCLFKLPERANSERWQKYLGIIMSKIEPVIPLAAPVEKFQLDYRLNFQNGSKKWLRPLDEIKKIKQRKKKLVSLVEMAACQLEEKIFCIATNFEPKHVYYWRIILKTPRINQVQSYFFNYDLRSLLLSLSDSPMSKRQLYLFCETAVEQVEKFLDMLEIRDSECFELHFDILKIGDSQILSLLNDSGVDLLGLQMRSLEITESKSELKAENTTITPVIEGISDTETESEAGIASAAVDVPTERESALSKSDYRPDFFGSTRSLGRHVDASSNKLWHATLV